MKHSLLGKIKTVAMTTGMLASVALAALPAAHAAAFAAAPRISFTFDDGLTSALTQAAPALQESGFTGTDYIITDCAEHSTTANFCPADPAASYMSWTQISQLAAMGWEMGSHTVDHPLLASTDPDFQPNLLSDPQVIAELANSKQALNAKGYPALSFAAPYGDYNNFTRSEAAKLYTSFRGFHDVDYNVYPYNDQLIKVQQVQGGSKVANCATVTDCVTVDKVKGYIDAAKAGNYWLVLVFHDIKPLASVSSNVEDYNFSTEELGQIAQYVKTSGIQVTNMSANLVTGSTNALPSGSFDATTPLGAYVPGTLPSATDWTTNDPTNVKLDTANHGSYPGPANSVSLKSGTATNYVISPLIGVSPLQTYVVKTYLNVSTITTGEVGFYVHEYDASGLELTGKWMKAEPTAFVENLNFLYTPVNAATTRVALEIYTTGTGIQAYVDNVQWLVDGAAPAPKPGDTNNDGRVDIFDLSTLSSNWGIQSGATVSQGDFNNDGKVDIFDLSTLSSNWSN